MWNIRIVHRSTAYDRDMKSKFNRKSLGEGLEKTGKVASAVSISLCEYFTGVNMGEAKSSLQFLIFMYKPGFLNKQPANKEAITPPQPNLTAADGPAQ